MTDNAISTNTRTRVIRGLLAALLALGLYAAHVPLGAGVNDAHAGLTDSEWVYPSVTYWQDGSQTRVNGHTYHRFYTNFWDVVMKASHGYGRTGWTGSGTAPSRARINPSYSWSGLSVSVSVSKGGIGFGFSASGDTCVGQWWEAPQSYTSISFGTEVICEGKSNFYLNNMSTTMAGGTLIGGSWSQRSSTRTSF